MISIKTKDEFYELIKGERVFVDFYADWCAPCKMLDMVLEEVESERDDYTFVRVDSDRFRALAKDYKVLTVPVVMVFSSGNVLKEQKGFMRKEEVLSFLDR